MDYGTVSIKLPIEKQIGVYNNFLTQYSLIVTSNLLVEELVSKSNEQDLLDFFDEFHGHFNDYNVVKNSFLMKMIDIEMIQAEETRGLWLDRLYVDMTTNQKMPSEIVLSIQRMKEYLLLFANFENTLKQEMYESNLVDSNKFIRENEIVKYLNDYLEKESKTALFYTEIRKRTYFKEFDEINKIWKMLNDIRNLFAHSGGIVTEKWLEKYKSTFGNNREILSNASLNKSLEAVYYDTMGTKLCNDLCTVLTPDQFEIDKMYYLNEELSNFFRNFIVAIAESLYCTLTS